MTTQVPKFAAKIADAVTRAHLDTKRRMAPDTVRMFMQLQEAFFTLTGAEHRSTSGGFWRDMLATGKLNGPAADVAGFLADGHGQWQTLLAGTATGAAMSGGILDFVTNEFAPGVQALLYEDPNKLLAPADAALAVARGIWALDRGTVEARKGAISSERFNALVELNTGIPSPDELRQLVNRGQLTEHDGQAALIRAGVSGQYAQALMEMRHTLLSPEQLATLVTFGAIGEPAAARLAALSGVSADDFALLVAGNGQPPSSEELLFAYRRKIIDKARLLRGITQGPIRNEWFDVIESLGQVPMSTADAIEAAIQGHLSKAEAQAITAENGLLPAHFEPLYQTAGSPPGPQQMLGWMNRRLMTEAEVKQGLTESRLKPKYVDLLIKSAVALPPMTVIRSAYARGTITHARAADLLGQHGYSAEDAAMILGEAQHAHTATIRHLTEAQILALRADRALTDVEAAGMLAALGYAPDDVTRLLDLAELERQRRLMDAALGRVRAAYVGRHISEQDAQDAMDALQVPAERRDDLLTIWGIEQTTVTKTLTLAQATAALKKGLITASDFTGRVSGMGYSPADVGVLLALAGGGQGA